MNHSRRKILGLLSVILLLGLGFGSGPSCLGTDEEDGAEANGSPTNAYTDLAMASLAADTSCPGLDWCWSNYAGRCVQQAQWSSGICRLASGTCGACGSTPSPTTPQPAPAPTAPTPYTTPTPPAYTPPTQPTYATPSGPIMERCMRRPAGKFIVTACGIGPATGDSYHDAMVRSLVDYRTTQVLNTYIGNLSAVSGGNYSGYSNDLLLNWADDTSKGSIAVDANTYPATFSQAPKIATLFHFTENHNLAVPPRQSTYEWCPTCHDAKKFIHWYDDSWVGSFNPFWSFERWWQRSKATVLTIGKVPVSVTAIAVVWQTVDLLTLTGLSVTQDAFVNWEDCHRNPGPQGCLREDIYAGLSVTLLSAQFAGALGVGKNLLFGSKTSRFEMGMVNGLRYQTGLSYSDDLYRTATQLNYKTLPANGVIVQFPKNGTWFAARNATNEVVGVLQIADDGYLYMIVDPALQRQGIGTLLMEDAIAFACSSGRTLYGQAIPGSASEAIMLRQGFLVFRNGGNRIIYYLPPSP